MIFVIRVTRISVETLCHATEDTGKVEEAMGNLLIPLERRNLQGHFGNPITILSGTITRKKDIITFMKNLKEKISQDQIDYKRCTDEKGSLCLRLDKQRLYGGCLALRNDGDVKIVIGIQAYPHRKEEVVTNARKIFESH